MNTLTTESELVDHCLGQRPEANGTAPPELKIRTILVPVDFSVPSEKALSYALPLARQFNARISLLHVCQEQFYGTELAYLPGAEASVNLTCTDRMHLLANRRIDPELLGEILVRHGLAFDEITKAAAELDADLIVIDTHGYTGLKHVLLGSTAERVIRHAPCPVLVVRSPGHGSD